MESRNFRYNVVGILPVWDYISNIYIYIYDKYNL